MEGCRVRVRCGLTEVLQDRLPFVSDFSAGVSHSFNVNTQTAIALKKELYINITLHNL